MNLDILTIVLIGVVIFCSYGIEGITGFGGTILALPFLSMLVDLKLVVVFMPMLSIILALYVIIRSWKNIVWNQLGFILFHVICTIPVGIWLFEYLPRNLMLVVLALFMIGVGIYGSMDLKRSKENNQQIVPKTNKIFMRLVLFASGIIQGAFSSGGPLVVIYAKYAFPDKGLFRVTLCLLWVVSNVILLFCKRVVFPDAWAPAAWKIVIAALPFLVCGMILGDYLHRKVNEYNFKIFVNILLIIMGITMFFMNI